MITLKFKIIRKHPNVPGVVEIENEIVGRVWVYESQIRPTMPMNATEEAPQLLQDTH